MTFFPSKRSWPRTFGDVWLLVRVFVMLTGLRLTLRWVRLDNLLRRFTPRAIPNQTDDRAMERVRSYADGLVWRIPYLRERKCLPRALTLYYFATRFGYPVRFHCGVCRGANQRLEGHAWLVLGGRPFLEPEDPTAKYAVTLTFPAPENISR